MNKNQLSKKELNTLEGLMNRAIQHDQFTIMFSGETRNRSYTSIFHVKEHMKQEVCSQYNRLQDFTITEMENAKIPLGVELHIDKSIISDFTKSIFYNYEVKNHE